MSDKTNGKLEGEHYDWPTQTDRQSHPIYDNQNNRMVGDRGPTRYRVGPNYLQLPINWPRTKVATNQRDGQMTYHVDSIDLGANPHVNYEPTSRGGPREAQLAGKPHTSYVAGHVVRQEISRTNDYKQAGERYRSFEDWERDDLINNLVSALQQKDIQERLVQHLSHCDSEYSARVAAGLSINVAQSTMEPVESR